MYMDPPDCVGWQNKDVGSQPLTYIRLLDAARIPSLRATMGFRTLPPLLAPRHWPKPCRSRHQVWEATGVIVFHLLPFAAIFSRISSSIARFLIRRDLTDSSAPIIVLVPGKERPDDAGILVGKSDRCDIGMASQMKSAKPETARISCLPLAHASSARTSWISNVRRYRSPRC